VIRPILNRNVGRLYAKLELLFFNFLAGILFLALVVIKLITGKKIVFCEFFSSRIGHMACELEIFLRRYKQGGFFNSNNTIYVGFCLHFPIGNRQLLKMYGRHLFIVTNKLFAKLLNTWIKKTGFYTVLSFYGNEYYENNQLKPVLSFTDEEKKQGRKLLSEMGIGEADWFVCFQARDPKYLGPGSEYHDYRDCDIENYLKAAEYIADRGGYAIRIGSVVDKPLSKGRHPNIIDYAVDFRSDFMDIFLLANCKFLLGSTSGPYNVSSVFGVPVACANFIPISFVPYKKSDLFVPKKIFSKAQGRHLTFNEIQDSELMDGYQSEVYKKLGVEVIENSSDEILEMAKEINMRLDGNYVPYVSNEEEYQKKFDAIFKLRRNGCPTKIGTYFLIKNRDMLVA